MMNNFSRFMTPNPLTVFTLDVSPDGESLVIGQEGDATSKIALGLWSIENCHLLATLVRGKGAVSLSARFSPSGNLLAYSDADQRMAVYDLQTGTASREIFPLSFAKWMSFANHRDRLIAGGTRTQVWDAEEQAVIWTLPVEPLPETADIDPPRCALTAGGDRVAASGVEEGRIVIYDISSAQILGGLEHSMDGARAMTFDPSDRYLAVVSTNGGVGLWDTETGDALLPQVLNTQADYYWCVRFHPDGQRIGFGLWSGFVEIIQLKDGRYTVNQDAPVHHGRVRDLAFTPDGRKMYTAGDDGAVLVWDI